MFYIIISLPVFSVGREMVPRVKDNTPLGKQKTVSLDFDEELARKGRQGNFKISKLITFN